MTRIDMTDLERKKLSELGKTKTPNLWQPIETAPKDKLVLIAYYWKKDHYFYEENKEWSITIGLYNDERYIDVAHLDLQEMDAVWQPLPEPPK
jgi:hypothetical protein